MEIINEQKAAIEKAAVKFLADEFSRRDIPVKVYFDSELLAIRISDFFSAAEVQACGKDKKSADLIQDTYLKQFEISQSSLIDSISGITGKKVMSTQIRFEPQNCLITIILAEDTEAA